MLSKLSELGNTICLCFSAVGTALSMFLGGWDILLKALVIFMITDYITGVVVAIIDKKLSSSVGFKGIAKKVAILALVGIAFYLDQVIGTDLLRNMAILFYIANEGISILENTSKLGVPYPQKLKDILEQLKTDNDKKEG